ncbi:hypothetical protein FDP41_003847 [Naegleria fowleri]|uniref:Cyclin-dependent kinase 8 n=1 Tax=Naegleria fowleri TaxID=5763 RepID=A0A6A5BSL8_NAEFO|nr:uncharacterized protein FDP41_003847 [Naegleria fowleri]KAF0977194.1 hypothetical protein FDP41_003847 [Naegleria fowleri]CAG4718909.1 unnamed protein product [Naegleria fowleri]
MNNLRAKSEQRFETFNRKYKNLGVIGKGAYGSVSCYEDKSRKKIAVKQFFMRSGKDDGIPITLCREINLLRELEHDNILKVQDIVISTDGSFNMICDFCKIDLEKLLMYHKTQTRAHNTSPPLPLKLDDHMIRSILYQILKGIYYLHSKWVIHRDLKPSNILINDVDGADRGCVKVADFGLARIFKAPLRKLVDDGPVVTIWYRSPELLLGSKHYTPALDIWSIGCIMYELYELKPLFKGEEVKQGNNPNPFQKDQLEKIFQVLGTPTVEQWPSLSSLPEYKQLSNFTKHENNLEAVSNFSKDSPEYDLLKRLLEYDPAKRITAKEALQHPYFNPKPSSNCFEHHRYIYPEIRPVLHPTSTVLRPHQPSYPNPHSLPQPPQYSQSSYPPVQPQQAQPPMNSMNPSMNATQKPVINNATGSAASNKRKKKDETTKSSSSSKKKKQ